MSVKPVLVVAGASGPVGRHLAAAGDCYSLRVLTHRPGSHFGPEVEATVWNPAGAAAGDADELEKIAHTLDGAAALVNLAGSPTTAGRLGPAHRERVVTSRVDSARALLYAHRRAEQPPPVWVQASATGYYGDAGERVVTEAGPKDDKLFFADVCQQWEAAPEGRGRRAARHRAHRHRVGSRRTGLEKILADGSLPRRGIRRRSAVVELDRRRRPCTRSAVLDRKRTQPRRLQPHRARTRAAGRVGTKGGGASGDCPASRRARVGVATCHRGFGRQRPAAERASVAFTAAARGLRLSAARHRLRACKAAGLDI